MTMRRTPLILGLIVAGSLGFAGMSDGAQNDVPAPDASASAPAPAAPPAGDPVAGKSTFVEYCSICHGVAGKGFIGPYIAGVNWTAPGLHVIVRGGLGGYGGMPAFNADAVTDKNIADIAAYLATLPPEHATTPSP